MSHAVNAWACGANLAFAKHAVQLELHVSHALLDSAVKNAGPSKDLIHNSLVVPF